MEDTREVVSKMLATGAYKQTISSSTITCYSISRFVKLSDKEGSDNDGAVFKYLSKHNIEPVLCNRDNLSIYFLIGSGYIYIGKCDKGTPLSRLINHTNPSDSHFSNWNKALIFIHSNNYNNCCDLYETALWQLAKEADIYSIDNDITPTLKYKNVCHNLDKDQQIIVEDIIEFTRNNDIRVFDKYNKGEKYKEPNNMAYIGHNNKGTVWVPEISMPEDRSKQFVRWLINILKSDIKANKILDKHGKPRNLMSMKFLNIAVKGKEDKNHNIYCEIQTQLFDQLYNEYRENEDTYGKYTNLALMNIVTNQVYGIGLSSKSTELAQKAVYGEVGDNYNIRYIDKYVQSVIEINTYNFDSIFTQVNERGEITNVHFDVIIGNPPYQDSSNNQIYPYFMQKAFESARYTCMITKSDWMLAQDTKSSTLFGSLRDKAFKQKHMRYICEYPKIGEIFKNAGVAVASFLYDNEYQDDCTYIQVMDNKVVANFVGDFSNGVIKNETLLNIVKRVRLKAQTFGETLNIRNNPFGLDTTGIVNVDVIKNGYETSYPTETNTIKLKSSDGYSYINKKILDEKFDNSVKKYNVICSKVVHAWLGNKENILTEISLLDTNEICTGTWTQLEEFESRIEAENMVKYLKTRFARALIKAGFPAYRRPGKFYFRYLSVEDFTPMSDIDWTKSITDIEKQLYNKYGISSKEIEYIESTIKEQ